MSNVRTAFHTKMASNMLDDILYKRSNIFYFLGKVEPWEDEESPAPDSANTIANDIAIRDNLLYLRRVSPSEVSLVSNRYDWASGTIFASWDHTLDQSNSNFYCITDEFNVYKCLDNNGAAVSTVKPTGNATAPFLTADGYLWKYMYNVPSFKRSKFLSSQKIPVQKALTDAFYSRGAIEDVSIGSGGSGYTTAALTGITINQGAGTGINAVLVPVVSKVNGAIIDVIIENSGSGYVDAGLSLTVTTTGGGTGIYGHASAVLKPIVYGGSIVNVTIEDPGTDYPPDLSTTILIQGDGTDAVLTPVVSAGELIDVIVEVAGQDYSYANLTVSGTGTNATVTAILSASDFLSDQSVVEQSAIPGAIYSIKVSNPGTGYFNPTQTYADIQGDGTGAIALVHFNNNGTIKKITMTSYGSGYTYAKVTIVDPLRTITTGLIEATAYAVLPPINGHGYNAVDELYGTSLVLFTQIKDDAELTLLAQDYRQYGILSNPKSILDKTNITTDINFIRFKVNVDNVTNLVVDQMLKCNNKYYRLVKITGLQLELQQLSQIYEALETNDVLTNVDSSLIQYVITSVTSVPVVDKYSGTLMYASNAVSFAPTAEILISIRTYFQF